VALDDSGDPELARQAAAALVVDPAVVAVVGHWQAETTAAAAPIYAQAGLPLLAAGQPPLIPFAPAGLPPAFRQAYEAVTPFAETPGAFAGPAYDAFQLLWAALQRAAAAGSLTPGAVANALIGLEYEGITGNVYQPLPASSR
jgi:ABC-type branched-subunit amino acid transport system substrate-binding protein